MVVGTAYISLVEVDREVLFLPQQPLLTTGSLSEQVLIIIIMNALKVLKPSRSFLHERWAFPSCINQFRF